MKIFAYKRFVRCESSIYSYITSAITSVNWMEIYCFILEVSSKLIHLQDKLKDFLEKKESGELLIQKASNLLQNILKKVRMRNRIIS